MSKRKAKLKDSSYYPPEMMGIIYCAAVLEIVLKEHPEAKELFEDIKECVLLPGVEDMLNTVEQKIPDGKKLLKGIVKEAGYNHKKTPPEKNTARLGRSYIISSMKIIRNYRDKLYPKIMRNRKRKRDLKLLTKRMERFIRVCFNNESEQAKGQYKIKGGTSETLVSCILLRAVTETYERYNPKQEKVDRLPMFQHEFYSIILQLTLKLPLICAN